MPGSLEDRLRKGGLAKESARKLAALARPAVRFTAEALPEGSDVALGASKLGGRPHVRPGFAWPRKDGRPLAFVGQVNLADVGRYAFCAVLPPHGVLAFFYDDEGGAWGFDPKDRGSWLVHFEADPAGLQPCSPPEAEATATPFPSSVLSPGEVETLPGSESTAFEGLGLEDAEAQRYREILDGMREEETGATAHRLLGHASEVQGGMQLECQLVSNGLYCGDPSGYNDPRARKLEAGAGRWQLLLQVDTDDGAGMMWGDCGRLYFWITEEALARRAFDETWMILQCS
jgi:uncharacterized protein YwqG